MMIERKFFCKICYSKDIKIRYRQKKSIIDADLLVTIFDSNNFEIAEKDLIRCMCNRCLYRWSEDI
jgi:hypothetical protein